MDKEIILTASGAVGAVLTFLFGGDKVAIITVLIFMAVDYLLGCGCALKGRSKHNGNVRGLDSQTAYSGLIKKGGKMLFIVVANRLDVLIAGAAGTEKIKIAAPMVIYAIIASELISILENSGRLGIKVPGPLKKYIKLLNKMSGDDGDDGGDSETDNAGAHHIYTVNYGGGEGGGGEGGGDGEHPAGV